MKLLVLIIIFLVLTNTVYSQTIQQHELEGYILDSITTKPVEFSTVSLFLENSPKPLNETLVNKEGLFEFRNLQKGVYNLIISFVGYHKKSIFKIIISTPKTSLGVTLLSPSAEELAAVTIVGRRPIFENKIDRLVYNADYDPGAAIGDASDLLRRVPMVSVDVDGNVAIRGKTNVKVLINGKYTGITSENIGDFLKSIPSTQIKSIEVITSPSAKYEAEGAGGIVNINTRQKVIDGIDGSVGGNIGTRQMTGNANLNGKVHKMMFNISSGINNKLPRNVGIDFYSFDIDGNSSSTKGHSTNRRLSNSSSATIQYDFNAKNDISSTFKRSSLGYDDDMMVQGINKSINSSAISYDLNSISEIRNAGFNWGADFLHRFDRKGEQLDIAIQWNQNIQRQNYQGKYSESFPNQRSENKGNNNEYTFQGDYILPINKLLKFQIGTKAISRKIVSNYEYFSINSLGNNTLNNLTSNRFKYKQNVYGSYVVVEFNLAKGWAADIGQRVELTYLNGVSDNSQIGIPPFSTNYTTYIPSFVVSKKTEKHGNFKLSYNKRIQRPSLQFLNPFRNTNDPLNQSQGTPTLSPEREQTIEMSYDIYLKKINISSSLYYKRTDDLIQSFVRTVPYTTNINGNESTQLVNLTNYGNIGANDSYGSNIFVSASINKSLNLRASFNVYTFHPSVYPNFNTYLNNGTFLLYNSFVSSTYKIQKEILFDFSYNFMSKLRTFQGTSANLNILNIGIKKDLPQKKGSIGIVAINPFFKDWNFEDYINTGKITQYRNLSTPFRSINLSLTYRFGKTKNKLIKERGINNDDLKTPSSN